MRRSSGGPLWAAMLGTTVGVLPVFFFGALAALMRDDLDFRQSQIGLATAAFFATGALLSVPGGWLAERLGGARTTAIAIVITVCSMLGIGGLTRSWAQLLPLMLLAGVANALMQPATNSMLAGNVPEHRRGLVFGTKQAAVPLASTVAGLALPVLGLTLGWRASFLVAAALGMPVLALVAITRGPRRPPAARTVGSLSGSGALLALAVVAALGAGAGNAMAAFYVDSAVSRGISAGTAGLLLAVGSGTGMFARIGWGWWTDRRRLAPIPFVAVLLLVGAGGFAVIAAQPVVPVLLLATVAAYAAGWGWNGVLVAAVIGAHPDAPAAATGITQAGVYGGAVLVPPLFGYLAETVSYAIAWASAAGLLCIAGCLAMIMARRHVLAPVVAGETSHTPVGSG
jgi:MFS family permease